LRNIRQAPQFKHTRAAIYEMPVDGWPRALFEPSKGVINAGGAHLDATGTVLGLMQRNHEEAARAVGIGTATLLRWQKQPEFQQAYRAARRAAHGQSIARLQQTTSAAAETTSGRNQ
jgi:hypothetical protein